MLHFVFCRVYTLENINQRTMKRILTKLFFVFFSLASSQLIAQKTVFTPTEWSNTGHEYYNRMSPDRMYQTENFVLYWGDMVGTNPQNASDAGLRFNPKAVADTFEFIFKRYITDLKFINNASTTNFGKYKTPVIILGTFSGGDDRTTGFAHASSYSNTIGSMFVHPSAVKDGGAISHEYAHALQMMMRIQENPGNGTAFAGYDWAGPFFEGHANFMRAQVYQKWANIDGTLTRWIQTRYFMWSSNRHHYTNYNLMFYVQEKEGFDFTRRMWAESKNQEHPIETIKRLKGFTQEQLNDYLYGYAAKDVAFDYPIQWNSAVNQNDNFGKVMRSTYQTIKNNLPRYTSRQYTLLDKVAGSSDRYFVNEDWAPQDYGMNIIPVYPTCTGTDKSVTIKFKGHAEVNINYAGWRYGFVTTKADGTVSRYSPMYSEADGEATFNLNTTIEANIYFVVFSAPKTHGNYNMDVGYPKTRRYPYELKIANAVPEGYQAAADFRKWRKTNGKLHSNGGGWVSNNSTVASTVYVGPYAMVLGGNLSGNARIEDFATVEGGNISGNAVVKGNAAVYNATISGDAVVSGNAWMEGGSVLNSAQVKGNAMVWGATYSNSVVVGGDAEVGSCATNGVYLQPAYWRNGRTECDGKGANDASNVDINPLVTLFADNQMAFATTPTCSGVVVVVKDCNGDDNGKATLDNCGICSGGNTGKKACAATIEAETACTLDGTIDNNNAGFSGTGFVNTDNALDKKVLWRLNSTINQTASLSFKYANGAAADRNGNLKVNEIAVGELLMPATGAWTTWKTVTINVNLVSGANELILTSNSALGLANIDLIYVSSGVSLGQCVITALDDLEAEKIQLYPNPTTGMMHWNKDLSWELTTALGYVLETGFGSSFDLSTYPSGNYFVKLEGTTLKVVKN